MKYTDIKPVSCPCCGGLTEDAAVHGLQFNRQTFYNNMRLWIGAGTASDLEGVDTLVRLGYLEKLDSQSIFSNFSMEHPISGAANRGSFNSTEDRVRMAYDLVFEPGAVGSGTSTLAHELRHRAFYIISVTPQLQALMPGELRDRWGNGYGASSYGVDRWRYQGAWASPEHAMIYAVQYRDPTSDPSRRRFFDNPALGGQTVQYWRDLYRATETAVRTWFRDRVPEIEPDTRVDSMIPPFELSAAQSAFYASLSRISENSRISLAQNLRELQLAFAVMGFVDNNLDPQVRNTARSISSAIVDQNFEVMPDLLRVYQQLETAVSNYEDAPRIRNLLNQISSTGISWRLMDIDTFTEQEFAALVRLRPDLVPAVPVARVEPAPATSAAAPRGAARASTPEPEQTPTVAPVGRRIGLYQFTVSTRMHPRHTVTLWDNISSVNSVQALRSAINGLVRLRMDDAGLTFDSTAQSQLQALYRILETDGYDSNVVARMLARIELVKG